MGTQTVFWTFPGLRLAPAALPGLESVYKYGLSHLNQAGTQRWLGPGGFSVDGWEQLGQGLSGDSGNIQILGHKCADWLRAPWRKNLLPPLGWGVMSSL